MNELKRIHFHQQKVLLFIEKYRWGVGLFIYLITFFLELHGSSIGVYSLFLNTPENNSAILGINRMRPDDWETYMPMVFSQYYDGGNGAFSFYSDIVRAAPTNMGLIVGQPCWNIVTFFRPFLWGYLFMSPSYGLSFYWMGQLIVLFLISYEFGKLLFQKNLLF